ncbi:unnamed protein product [Rotaria socialis]|uniref:Uncharacterized protein n=2 Tax=Rotaria socialis TaxID=392032 RepID=A0A817XUC5_9BILA|nr:unnamed protein product [Rotaria socialis]CAF3364174.1 unnamed protein product [Rotaria socialis]CAF3372378.1 unnamed protein product [Rotaria socialis]CAF3620537.1 unnamed protein product [Rotaria socialis]
MYIQSFPIGIGNNEFPLSIKQSKTLFIGVSIWYESIVYDSLCLQEYEVQLKTSSIQMYYDEFDRFDMNNEEIHLNRTWESDNGISYNSSIDQVSMQILNPNTGHISTSMDIMNSSPHMKIQNINSHHQILDPSDSINPNGMILSNPGGLSYASNRLLFPPLSSNTMQQHLHHLPPPHCTKMQNMDPLLAPSPNHQQQYMGLLPMMDGTVDMGPLPHHTLIHSSNRQSLQNDPLYLSILDDVRNFP